MSNRELTGWTDIFLNEYWWPIIAATIVTLPVTWYWFGRASMIGLMVNMLVLHVTPLNMMRP